jgi:cell division protein FtsB
MIRTLEEVQGSRLAVNIREVAFAGNELTVRLTIDGSLSTVPLGGQEERLYTAEEVGNLQAGEAELVSAPLRRQVAELEAEVDRLKKGHVCTSSCKPNAHVAFTGRQRLEELERQVHDETERADNLEDERNRLARRVAELERSLSRSIDRENRMETERAELDETHRQSLAARDRLLGSATTRIRSARELLTTPEVAQARRMDCSRTGTTMGYAIGAALRVLEGPPSPPTDETSQA